MNSKPQFTDNEILEIAKLQKAVIWFFLISVLTFWIPFASIVIGIIFVVFTYKLARLLRSSAAWAYCVFAFIPIAATVSLLTLSNKATAALRQRGIRVGLIGANRADVENISQSLSQARSPESAEAKSQSVEPPVSVATPERSRTQRQPNPSAGAITNELLQTLHPPPEATPAKITTQTQPAAKTGKAKKLWRITLRVVGVLLVLAAIITAIAIYMDMEQSRRWREQQAREEARKQTLKIECLPRIEMFDGKMGASDDYFGKRTWTVSARVRNDSRGTLTYLAVKIFIHNQDDQLIQTTEISLGSKQNYGYSTSDVVLAPGEVTYFSENLNIQGVPQGFKWNWQVIDGEFK